MLHGHVKDDIVRPALRAIVNGPWFDETGHFMSNAWHTAVCVALGERNYQNIMNFVRVNRGACCCAVFVGDTSEGDLYAAQKLLEQGWITAAFIRDAATDARMLSCCILPRKPAHQGLHFFSTYNEAAEKVRQAGYICTTDCEKIHAEVAAAQGTKPSAVNRLLLGGLSLVLDIGLPATLLLMLLCAGCVACWVATGPHPPVTPGLY